MVYVVICINIISLKAKISYAVRLIIPTEGLSIVKYSPQYLLGESAISKSSSKEYHPYLRMTTYCICKLHKLSMKSLTITLATLLLLHSATALQQELPMLTLRKNGIARFASCTYYTSYPACCPNSPTFDPSAPTEECDDYSGCEYIGDFAALGHKSLYYVQHHNLIAFFDANDPKGIHFQENYGNRTIEIRKVYNGSEVVFNATIADTCSDSDCNGCCSLNAQPTGFLVDIEYYTAINNFQTTDAAEGQLSFVIF